MSQIVQRYNYSIENRTGDKDYAHVKVEGEGTLANAHDILSTVISYFHIEKHLGLVFDISELVLQTTVSHDYIIARLQASLGFDRIPRYAIFGNPVYVEKDDFFAVTASNAGVKVHFFYHHPDEAIGWVTGKEVAPFY